MTRALSLPFLRLSISRMGWLPSATFLQYGSQLVKHRKIFQQFFSKQECLSYKSVQYQEACTLIRSLMNNPNNYDESMRRFTTAITIKIAYGHGIISDDDEYLKLTEELGSAVSNTGPVGNTPVDWIPICQSNCVRLLAQVLTHL